MTQKYPISTGGLLTAAALLCLVLWAAPGWNAAKAEQVQARESAAPAAKTQAPAPEGTAPVGHEGQR